MTHPLTLADAQALAANFIEHRRALHGDLRMEDDGNGNQQVVEQPKPDEQKPDEQKPNEPVLTSDEIAELIAAREERDALKAAQMSQAEKDAAERQKAEERAVKAEREAARYKVAAEKGVPASLLAGDDEKAMRASADALIEYAKTAVKPGGPLPDPSQGNREQQLVSSADEGRAEAQRRIAARNARIKKS